MAREPRHDILFEPVRIGPKTLRNRFYQVPHCTGFGVEKPWTQAAFRGMKAEGGWAAVCTEYCSISPESDETPYVSARLWDDEDMRALALMTEAAHDHGALAGVELWHGGVYAESREARLPQLAPSQIASDMDSIVVPKAMERADIRRAQAEWVAAARRARSAGFDIVYVYGSHTYLPTQFLSPVYNRRTDEYGGRFENRARFWLEAIELVKEAIGDDVAIAVRIAADTLELSGVPIDEGLEFIRAADHMVDLWDVVIGAMWGPGRLDSGPSRFFDQGYQMEWSGRAREATGKPIVVVGRFTDPDRMADLIRGGTVDLIGAARPSISDPFLPSKIEEGRYDDIRECIGCNACYSRSIWGRHLGCTQNATAGEEHRRGWHPERFPPAANADRAVLVVGAGPAGMECATVLGKRGMELVHLVDGGDDIGGCMRWITRMPGLGTWGHVIDYRRVQLGRLENVSIGLGAHLDAEAVRDYGAQIVIVATGAHWRGDGLSGVTRLPIPGADAALPHVMTPEQVMVEGKRPRGSRVAVIDYEGYFTATAIAEQLRSEGLEVEFVTSHEAVAPYCDQTLEGLPVRRRLNQVGVRVHRAVVVESIERDGIRLHGEFQARSELEVDGVVLVTQRRSDDELYHALAGDPAGLEAAGIEALYRIGDCVAPRLIADAIFDGHRLAREVDSPDPSRPLPYLRERPLMPAPEPAA
ncbi:MAG TPA: FAD-dependent oxidoreductase [Gaiellales bacterium]|nr:FAD-dependent oxidoreductase [Gaiellales bacterium]